MPTVATAIARLEEAIPLAKAASWDAVGLQVGDRTAPADTVAVCHEVSAEVIAAAVDSDCDLLVSYHPLLFRPTRGFVAGTTATGRAFELARAGVALYVVHTAYDVAPGGCADSLATALGIENVTGFAPNWPADSAKVTTYVPPAAAEAVTAALARAGAGEVGKYQECSFTVDGVGSFRPAADAAPAVGTAGELNRESEVRIEMNLPAGAVDRVVTALVAAHPYEEPAYDVYTTRSNAGFIGRIGDLPADQPLGAFGSSVADALATPVRMAGAPESSIRRVAVVPGAGGDFVAAAAAAGADVMVTGDVSHHRASEALRRGVAVVDAEHAATERPGIARLYSLVSEMFATTLDLTHLDPTPWGSA